MHDIICTSFLWFFSCSILKLLYADLYSYHSTSTCLIHVTNVLKLHKLMMHLRTILFHLSGGMLCGWSLLPPWSIFSHGVCDIMHSCFSLSMLPTHFSSYFWCLNAKMLLSQSLVFLLTLPLLCVLVFWLGIPSMPVTSKGISPHYSFVLEFILTCLASYMTYTCIICNISKNECLNFLA